MDIFEKLYAQERQNKAKETERLLHLQKAIQASESSQ